MALVRLDWEPALLNVAVSHPQYSYSFAWERPSSREQSRSQPRGGEGLSRDLSLPGDHSRSQSTPNQLMVTIFPKRCL